MKISKMKVSGISRVRIVALGLSVILLSFGAWQVLSLVSSGNNEIPADINPLCSQLESGLVSMREELESTAQRVEALEEIVAGQAAEVQAFSLALREGVSSLDAATERRVGRILDALSEIKDSSDESFTRLQKEIETIRASTQ